MTTFRAAFGVIVAAGLGAPWAVVGCGGGGSDAEEAPPANGAGGGGGASGKAGAGGISGQAGSAGGVITGGSGGKGGGQGLPDHCDSAAECKGFECCDHKCVDLKTDVLHCGKCGGKCDGADKGLGFCNAGACAKCPDGKADCDALSSNQCEVDLKADVANCGACGKACLLANADGSSCDAGACKIGTCKPGFADCDKKPDNGCEASTANDADNCGGCGMKCPAVTNGKASCELGKCGKLTCNEGFADCDGKPENGCETDLAADINNCGACKAKCDAVPHGTAKCSDGLCLIGTCDKGFDDCDQSSGNGCETDLSTDVANCAACGQKCPPFDNGEAACSASKCSTGKCNPGYDDCDPAKPGCETNLATSVQNCGACGNACPDIAHGKPGCTMFSCGVGTCDKGFADCVGGSADGCETDILADVNHCGSCDNVCPDVDKGTSACLNGQCAIGSCEGTFDDCNNTVFDGCEANKASDKDNCGACGNACQDPTNATAMCKVGQCAIKACAPGFGDCDGNYDNGCEQPTDSDPSNCGGCGVVCGSGACEQGACVCIKSVLLIADDSQSGTTTLAGALKDAGLQVTQTPMPVWQYAGTPSPSGMGAVIVLSGGPSIDPANNSFVKDMPADGQKAIVDFVKASNGLVLTEWAALHASKGQWADLAPYVLLQRTLAFSGLVTYTVDPAFASHPLWAGLPPTFTFGSTSNVGLTVVGSGNKRVASSPQALDALAIRDEPNQGRVVHLAHAGNYAPDGWGNTNIQKLVANAALWAARCK